MPYRETAPKGVGRVGQKAMTVLYQHRLLSTDQLYRLITPHHSRSEKMRVHLQALRAAGLAECTGRRVHGQTCLLWWLTPKGAEAVEAVGAQRARPFRMNAHIATGPLQDHTLDTAETGLAFVDWARKLGHDCGPLDWVPETDHYYRDDTRPGEDLTVRPDAVLNYVHTNDEARQRTLLTFFLEVDRSTETIAALAQKVHAYACYQQFIPPAPPAGRGQHSRRRSTGVPAWRHRYPAFPRLLLVFSNAEQRLLERRIADLRSLAAANPYVTANPVRAGATTLTQLREHGPFAPIFTPILGPAHPTDAWLRPPKAFPEAA